MARIIAAMILMLSLLLFPIVRADEYDDVSRQLSDLNKALAQSQNATKHNESTLTSLRNQLDGIKNRVAILEQELVKKTKEVKDGEKALIKQKEVFDQRTVSYYKNLGKNPFGLVNLLVTDDLSKSLQNFFYYRSLIDEDRKTIIKVVFYIKNLEDKKVQIEKETKQLAVIKDQVDKQSKSLAGEIDKSKQYENVLAAQIATLNARQQQLLAQKLAGLNIPRSAGTSQGGCVSDVDVDPGFSPRIAFFTLGVPNRVGLNQYGAYGRSQAGQSYDQILHAYYNYDNLQDVDQNIQINVEGHGSFSLEEYMKRIYEVPNSWGDNGGMEALKAQAIAARSYALAYTNNGSGSICATDSCQVFQDGPKGGHWEEAVNATAGKAMVQGGQTVKAWFSSTHGGYIHSSGDVGWSDTGWTKNSTDFNGSVSSFSDLKNNAYDKASPWFYCDWGSRAEYNHTAWLKQDEVADIANVIDLARRDSGVNSHIYQVDKPNPEGAETWDHERVKQELRSRGGNPINLATDVAINWDTNSGKVTGVTITGDNGSMSFSPAEFKGFFNLRAPANIQIVGPLYNVERR